MLGGDVPPLLASVPRHRIEGTLDLLELVARYQGRQLEGVHFEPDDVAVLTYTSGTTGPPPALPGTGVPVPEVVAMCGDDSVLVCRSTSCARWTGWCCAPTRTSTRWPPPVPVPSGST